jgi:toluene monooxygenase system protein E
MAVRPKDLPLKKHAGPREREGSKLKTYSHLSSERRIPSDYEVVTSRLLYYPGRGFELNLPLGAFYQAKQAGSLLRLADPERFADPRETTYSRYVARCADGEAYAEGVTASMDENRYDEGLAPAWKQMLAGVLGALRFPIHGFQMASAYIGQMAPSGKMAVCALFQTADEVRRVQRIAYRLTELVGESSAVGHGKASWEGDAAWQPLRELVERTLIVFDWGEALVALNVCIKPIVDEVFMIHLASVAKEHGDYQLTELFGSLATSCRWHGDWAFALLDLAFQQDRRNCDVASAWVSSWQPRAVEAARALEPVVPGAAGAAERARGAIERRWAALESAPART